MDMSKPRKSDSTFLSSSWGQALAWQGIASQWPTWLFFRASPISSASGRWTPWGSMNGWEFQFNDVYMCVWWTVLLFCSLSAARYPELAAYYGLLKDRPSIKASWPPSWLEKSHTLRDVWEMPQTPKELYNHTLHWTTVSGNLSSFDFVVDLETESPCFGIYQRYWKKQYWRQR